MKFPTPRRPNGRRLAPPLPTFDPTAHLPSCHRTIDGYAARLLELRPDMHFVAAVQCAVAHHLALLDHLKPETPEQLVARLERADERRAQARREFFHGTL